jgi:glycosyltransferase involved in cell wall biosynthesis
MQDTLYGWPYSLKVCSTRSQVSELDFGHKLSIVIPTLNQGETLEHTLLSIINQDYKNFEIIVMDGGSSDITPEIIDRYRSWIDHYQSGSDGGQSEAINSGFRKAQGKIFAWINSDDYYLPGAFSAVISEFSRNPTVDIIVGAGDIVTKNSKFLKHIDGKEMSRSNLLNWHNDQWIMQQSCFWTAEVWKKCGGVDESLQLLMDYDLWMRFSLVAKSSVLDKVLAVMRYYPEAKSVSMKDKVREEEAYVYAKNGELEGVRRVVSELVIKNINMDQEIHNRDRSIGARLMRRFGLYI